jgi:hypothetical protein
MYVRLNEVRVWRKRAHQRLHDPERVARAVRSADSALVMAEKKSTLGLHLRFRRSVAGTVPRLLLRALRQTDSLHGKTVKNGDSFDYGDLGRKPQRACDRNQAEGVHWINCP